jgi:hypothetical protein
MMFLLGEIMGALGLQQYRNAQYLGCVHKKWHLSGPTPSLKKRWMFHSIVGLGDMDIYICVVVRWLKHKSLAIGLGVEVG